MIVSYAHNFVFIKTEKTAGTTVELVLSQFCGSKDIITPIGIADDSLRYEFSGCVPQNYSDSPELELQYLMAVRRKDEQRKRQAMSELRGQGSYYNHMPARDIAERLDPLFWKSAFKFTIERHPYEKAVSKAFFRLWWHDWSQDRFAEVLDNIVNRGLMDDFPKYSIDGQSIVDEILKQESIDIDLPRVLRRFGLTFEGPLPRTKADIRLDRRPAREILSPSQQETIYRMCRSTFDALGYEP